MDMEALVVPAAHNASPIVGIENRDTYLTCCRLGIAMQFARSMLGCL